MQGLVEIYRLIGCTSTRTGFRHWVRLSGSCPRRESRRQRLRDSAGGMREMEKEPCEYPKLTPLQREHSEPPCPQQLPLASRCVQRGVQKCLSTGRQHAHCCRSCVAPLGWALASIQRIFEYSLTAFCPELILYASRMLTAVHLSDLRHQAFRLHASRVMMRSRSREQRR